MKDGEILDREKADAVFKVLTTLSGIELIDVVNVYNNDNVDDLMNIGYCITNEDGDDHMHTVFATDGTVNFIVPGHRQHEVYDGTIMFDLFNASYIVYSENDKIHLNVNMDKIDENMWKIVESLQQINKIKNPITEDEGDESEEQ